MNRLSRDHISRVCHEANKAYCESIGDMTQPSWDDAPQWQKDSCRSGVDYHMDASGTTPEDSHTNWLADKEKDGWVYGPVKDPEKKTHPCMVPYSSLPKDQQIKDYIFHAIVSAMGPFV